MKFFLLTALLSLVFFSETDVLEDLIEERAFLSEELYSNPKIIRKPWIENGFTFNPLKFSQSEENQWVKLSWNERQQIDSIVIFPKNNTLNSNKSNNIGFPDSFLIYSEGEKVLEYRVDKRVAENFPVIIRGLNLRTQSIKIAAKGLAYYGKERGAFLALSEIQCFSGYDNVALNGVVTASGDSSFVRYYSLDSINDNITPYGILIEKQGEYQEGYIDEIDGKPLKINLNFSQKEEVRAIVFHAKEIVRRPDFLGFGLPTKFSIYDGDKLLLEVNNKYLLYKERAALRINLPEVNTDNLTVVFQDAWRPNEYLGQRVMLSEITAHGLQDENLTIQSITNGGQEEIKALSDGYSGEGTLLSPYEFIEKLSLLESKQKRFFAVEERIQTLQEKKDRIQNRILVTLSLVFIGLIILLIFQNRQNRKKIENIRKKVSTGIHDEIATNLSSLKLKISRMASKFEGDEQKEFNQVRDILKSTIFSSRQLALLNFNREFNSSTNLRDFINKSAKVHLPDAKLEMNINAEALESLKGERRVHFAYFLNECLSNISKHTEATEIVISFTKENRYHFRIQDNDFNSVVEEIPYFLKLRAQLLKGKVTLNPSLKEIYLAF